MTGYNPGIEDARRCIARRARGSPLPWKLDLKESTKFSLKYRRGKGEILIVGHDGRGS
jgi:hypothetical protein